MPKYKSSKSVSTADPIVVSFTIGDGSTSYQFSVSNSSVTNTLSIDTNYQFKNTQKSQFAILSFSNQNGILFIENYGDELFGNKIEIVKKITEASNINYIIDTSGSNENFIPNWEDASDGSSLFVKTDNISDISEVLYKGLDYYIQDYNYNVVPAIAIEDETLFIFSSSENDIQFLCLDYQLSRNISTNPLTQIISYSNENVCFSHYQDDTNINSSSHRVRFVVSDQGRTISVSSLDNSNKFNHLKSFIFPQKIQSQASLTLNLLQNDYIKDITANF